MKIITTIHSEIGYSNNLEIIERALVENFLLDDNSYVLRAVAAHIWSGVGGLDKKQWTTNEVLEALAQCGHRLARMTDLVNKQVAKEQPATCDLRGCAVSYPHSH